MIRVNPEPIPGILDVVWEKNKISQSEGTMQTYTKPHTFTPGGNVQSLNHLGLYQSCTRLVPCGHYMITECVCVYWLTYFVRIVFITIAGIVICLFLIFYWIWHLCNHNIAMKPGLVGDLTHTPKKKKKTNTHDNVVIKNTLSVVLAIVRVTWMLPPQAQ